MCRLLREFRSSDQRLLVLQEWPDWTHDGDFPDISINILECHRCFLENTTNTLTVCHNAVMFNLSYLLPHPWVFVTQLHIFWVTRQAGVNEWQDPDSVFRARRGCT